MCIPKRVYWDNQLRANRYFDEMLSRVSSDGTSFDPDATTPSDPENLSGFDSYYYFVLRIATGVFAPVQNHFSLIQTKLDQARLAIAIERFGMIRDELPETLAELVPDFIAKLPRDIYTGQPMIYRRKEGGGFLLYSVGPDRRDGGGATNAKDSEKKQPDWVWLHSRD